MRTVTSGTPGTSVAPGAATTAGPFDRSPSASTRTTDAAVRAQWERSTSRTAEAATPAGTTRFDSVPTAASRAAVPAGPHGVAICADPALATGSARPAERRRARRATRATLPAGSPGHEARTSGSTCSAGTAQKAS